MRQKLRTRRKTARRTDSRDDRLILLRPLTRGLLGLGFVACLATVACSDETGPQTNDAAILDGPNVPISDGPFFYPCPYQELPRPQSACPNDREGLVCEYGTDRSCLATATCKAGVWEVVSPPCLVYPNCPSTREEAVGELCSKEGIRCNFSGLACNCTNCTTGGAGKHCEGDLRWHCDAPNVDPNCPPARPLLGTPCPKEGYFCNYGCQPDISRRCTGKIWGKASAPGGCPAPPP